MGITIHFQGSLVNERSYNSLIEKVVEFSKYYEWDYFLFENETKTLDIVKNEEDWNYIGFTKGIQLQPHKNSEPLNLEFDNQLYVQEFCKTQFSDIDTHLKVIELFHLIKNEFENLTIFDEGEFWETNDENILEKHWENFFVAMNDAMEENSKLKGPFKLENGRIIDLM